MSEKKLAIITVLYDYPKHFKPVFENKLLKDFPSEDYFVIRYSSIECGIQDKGYYFKFTYYRIRKMIDWVRDNLLGKYKNFILLDATDVAYVGGIYDSLKLLDEYETNILFGAERNLWPNTNFSHLYKKSDITTPYKFLNAGVFITRTEDYVKACERIIKRELFGLCDQGNWQIDYLTEKDVKLDFNTKLVLNTFEASEDIKIDNKNVVFLRQKPIFVHDNGGYNDKTTKLLNFFR